MTPRTMLTALLLAVAILATPTVFAQYDTFYSPEKRFSIDYPIPLQKNITDNINKTNIMTEYIAITITTEPDIQTSDIDEQSIHLQKYLQDSGHKLIQVTKPILIDNELGYVFTMNDDDLIFSIVHVKHGDKIYTFTIYSDLGFWLDSEGDHVNQIVNSIKFFN